MNMNMNMSEDGERDVAEFFGHLIYLDTRVEIPMRVSEFPRLFNGWLFYPSEQPGYLIGYEMLGKKKIYDGEGKVGAVDCVFFNLPEDVENLMKELQMQQDSMQGSRMWP